MTCRAGGGSRPRGEASLAGSTDKAEPVLGRRRNQPVHGVRVASGLHATARPILAVGVVTGALGAHAMVARPRCAMGSGRSSPLRTICSSWGHRLGSLATGQEVGLGWVVWGTVLFSMIAIFGLLRKGGRISLPFLGPVTPDLDVLMIAPAVGGRGAPFGRIRWMNFTVFVEKPEDSDTLS